MNRLFVCILMVFFVTSCATINDVFGIKRDPLVKKGKKSKVVKTLEWYKSRVKNLKVDVEVARSSYQEKVNRLTEKHGKKMRNLENQKNSLAISNRSYLRRLKDLKKKFIAEFKRLKADQNRKLETLSRRIAELHVDLRTRRYKFPVFKKSVCFSEYQCPSKVKPAPEIGNPKYTTVIMSVSLGYSKGWVKVWAPEDGDLRVRVLVLFKDRKNKHKGVKWYVFPEKKSKHLMFKVPGLLFMSGYKCLNFWVGKKGYPNNKWLRFGPETVFNGFIRLKGGLRGAPMINRKTGLKEYCFVIVPGTPAALPPKK